MAAAAVPAISLGAQYFLNRGANKRTTQALNTATTGLQNSGDALAGYGDTLAKTASPVLGQAQQSLSKAGNTYDRVGSYLSPLVSGSRSAINQSLAPDLAAITETYRGAGKALDGMRGGTRDLALAELNRDRAGKLALLPSQARAGAASGLLQVGQGQAGIGATQAGTAANLFGQATSAKQGATGAYGTLFAGADRQAQRMYEQNNQAGSSIGRMIFDSVNTRGKKAGGGGGGVGDPAGAWDTIGVG